MLIDQQEPNLELLTESKAKVAKVYMWIKKHKQLNSYLIKIVIITLGIKLPTNVVTS